MRGRGEVAMGWCEGGREGGREGVKDKRKM